MRDIYGFATFDRPPLTGPRGTAAERSALAGACALLALAMPGGTASAQPARCEAPRTAAPTSRPGGSTAQQRLRDRNPMIREMARADILSDEGRRDEAVAIYRRLAAAPADRRQTARRANLRLAQEASTAGDFGAAQGYLATAVRPGAGSDIVAQGRRLREMIAFRRGIAESEAALDSAEALVAAGQTDAALQATQALLARPCPYPTDYQARVKTRMARIHRARGDYAAARAAALEAQAEATTPNIRQGTETLLVEIAEAERAAALRAQVTQANTLIAAGNAQGAIAVLEPMLAGPPLPAELDTSVRLRLARAYSLSGRHDAAVALVEPLRARPGIDAETGEAISRIYLARAGALPGRGEAAAAAYREILAASPVPEVRDNARLGLGRALARTGDRRGALEQIALVRDGGASPELIERATRLYTGVENETPLNRLFGWVETGIAYDTNVPARIAAVRDDDDDVLPFPPGQSFDDFQVNLAARLGYRRQFGQGDSYLDFSAAASRSFQFDLPQLDRTRLDLTVGPVFAINGGQTELRAGASFTAEWRGGAFRSSEPGVYVGVRQRFSPQTSLSLTYALAAHNDYREERDGIDHTLSAQLRYEPTDADVVTFEVEGEREGGKLDRVRNWSLAAGASWRHRWRSDGRVTPFVGLDGEVERVWFDGPTTAGIERRDWRVKLAAEAGVEIDRNWRLSATYAYYDVSSTAPERNLTADHQVGLKIRYEFD